MRQCEADFTKSSLDLNFFHFRHGPPPVLRWRTYIWPCSERTKRRPRESITVEFYIFFFLTSTERFSVNVKFSPREYLSYWSYFVVYMKFFPLHVVSASSYCIGTEHRKCSSFFFTKILLPRLFQFIIHLLTHSMEQRPSWEANRFSASHETYRIYGPEGSIPHSQQPATCPYPERRWFSPCPNIRLLEDPF